MKKIRKKLDIRYIWEYYKIIVILCAAVLVVGAGILAGLLRQEPKADYEIALLTPNDYTSGDVAGLESTFESLGTDLDGDGTVSVQIDVYKYRGVSDSSVTDSGSEATASSQSGLYSAYQNIANTVWFKSEVSDGRCVIYLLDQGSFDALEGEMANYFRPLEDITGSSGKLLPLDTCAGFGNADNPSLWEGLSIALRNDEGTNLEKEKNAAYYGACLELFRAYSGGK